MKFELCTDCVEGAIIAGKFGFTSIELCSALSSGGLTPNYGLIKHCTDRTEAEVHVMIRHKEGGFQASEDDIKIMKMDIKAASKAGAEGVVFGILDVGNEVDEVNRELVDFAKTLDLKTTFHRAFDFVSDFRASIKKIVSFGFDRLLTSGLEPKAHEGLQVIAEIERTWGDQIEVIAGSGIHAGNALNFSESGINYLHFTARKTVGEALKLSMGHYMITDSEKIKDIIGLPFP